MCSKKDPTTRKQSVSSQKLVKEHMAIQIFFVLVNRGYHVWIARPKPEFFISKLVQIITDI